MITLSADPQKLQTGADGEVCDEEHPEDGKCSKVQRLGANSVSPIDGFGIIPSACTNGATWHNSECLH